MSGKIERGPETTLVVRGVSLPYRAPAEEALSAVAKKLKARGLRADGLIVYKRSVDARKKKDIRFVYSVAAKVRQAPDKLPKDPEFALFPAPEKQPEFGLQPLDGRVLVVGFGPCGMFAALKLAQAGMRPIVIERGDGIEERTRKVELFNRTGELDCESNIQFGAGGAGSFSDGKLITRIGDALCTEVLETYARHGAPESILTLAKPHIGTDKLFFVSQSIEREIRSLGGEVRYRTKLLSLRYNAAGRVTAALTADGEIPCGAVVLAIGHSARDTYRMLHVAGYELKAKDFSVGLRVEHLQEDIDRAMYGDADISILGHAEYGLSYREGERGVYSFCMCPGGEVICASSEEGGIVVNGMSRYLRDGRNANSAIAVSVLKGDYGDDPMKAIGYQEQFEKRAFAAGGGAYRAPIQTLGDFMNGKTGAEPRRILPTFRGGAFVKTSDLTQIFPVRDIELMRRGFAHFDKCIKGFAVSDALLTGVETRTSAPLRIVRGEDATSPGHDNVYPCGEGAGYAGGITSAAVDGIRTAYRIISKYRPTE